MKPLFFCPRWGREHLDWASFFEQVKLAGYDGIELGIAANISTAELTIIWNLAEKYHLMLIAQHYDTLTSDFNQHLETYHQWLEKMNPYPVYAINSQTGKDFFSFEQNRQLIELGCRCHVLHETHRGKFSFAAHITRHFLEKIPALKLTFDVSHWVCVAESLLEDQPEALELALLRTAHIHARIGFQEGPQIPDPRIDTWTEVMNAHFLWWDQIAVRKKKAGEPLTITPEFGPFPYMTRLPTTGEPIADQWEVNRFMMEQLRKRYE